jgi:hypothetical protein
MARFVRGLLAVLVPLTVVAVLAAAAVLWTDQQSARARLAEAQLEPALARAEAAEARAVQAEASLTAIAVERVADASATATTVARASEPQRALERTLGRLFAVFQDPTGSGYNQLADLFSAAALQTVRPEADYLRGRGQHLGGASTWSLTTSPLEQVAPDRAQIHTVERWLYDELDTSDVRQRCFIEDSDQTYALRLNDTDKTTWIIDEIQLGTTHRSTCPPGT